MALRPVKPETSPTPTPSPTPASDTAPTFNSAKIPNTRILDQDGKQLNFYDDLIKGRTVAINFIFTTCTTVCPPLTATFRKVQQIAAERGLDVKLVSISVDPVVDTPERLQAFAEKFKVDQGWTFVTGDKGEIDTLLEALGASVANKNDHTPMILIGNDSSNYWTRAYGLSSPSRLVELIAEATRK
jgi:cytochrome oxidase Cu insertion factor (SCO1/SenC/PrrC family)